MNPGIIRHPVPYFLFLVVLPGGCTSGDSVNYARLSEAELEAFNEGRANEEKVYCIEEYRTNSHIKKRECKELGEWAESRGSGNGIYGIEMLQILSSGI